MKPKPKPKHLVCRHGKVKRKFKGKARCVKRHKPARHHRGHAKHRRHPA